MNWKKWFMIVWVMLIIIQSGDGRAQANEKASPARPNFVFFITDDISPNDLGCYGNIRIKTPHLDRIAQEGLVFDNAYLTISSCSPSRCSIITGRYPHNTGAPELHTSLPDDQLTFIQVFQQAGYHTVLSGKNHMANPKQLGFDVSSDSHPAGSEKWIDHLRDRPQDKPFFFWFASHDAHYGWQINDKAPTYDPANVWVPPMLYDGPLTREEVASYYHEVSRTDYYAGQVVEELNRQSIADETYFIYCADNGRPLPRCKTYLYESGIQTPLIVTGPGVMSGRTDSLVSSVDFAATFLDLAGLEKPESIQGVSFRAVLNDHQAVTRGVAFAERNWHVYRLHERMVRYGDWLYIWNGLPDDYNVCGESSCWDFPVVRELWEMAEKGRLTAGQLQVTLPAQPVEQLFHVRQDPFQFYNLVDNSSCQEELQRMRSLLADWKQQTGDSQPENLTPDRQPLHEHGRKQFKRGTFPGADKNATTINHPGPVLVGEKSQ